MKVGIEQEFFVMKEGEFIAPVDINIRSYDACGFLAEIRTGVFLDAEHVLYDLHLKQRDMDNIATSHMAQIFAIPRVKLPSKFYFKMVRRFGKGTQHDRCMYGEVKSHTYQTAGLHIHFSDDDKPLDMPRIISFLDKRFARVIKDSGRQKGLYEMKHWGFEYRSLPTDVPLSDVEDAIRDILTDKY